LATIKAIATRSMSFGRMHLNVAVTAGSAVLDDVDESTSDDARWMGGVAIDRALPLRSILLAAEVFAERPMPAGSRVRWNVGAGVRWQGTPRLALDAGAGLRMTSDGPPWYATFGAAYAFGVRSLIPIR
jgi:hypothetical protein